MVLLKIDLNTSFVGFVVNFFVIGFDFETPLFSPNKFYFEPTDLIDAFSKRIFQHHFCNHEPLQVDPSTHFVLFLAEYFVLSSTDD